MSLIGNYHSKDFEKFFLTEEEMKGIGSLNDTWDAKNTKGASISITSVAADDTEKTFDITLDSFQYKIIGGFFEKQIRSINRMLRNRKLKVHSLHTIKLSKPECFI